MLIFLLFVLMSPTNERSGNQDDLQRELYLIWDTCAKPLKKLSQKTAFNKQEASTTNLLFTEIAKLRIMIKLFLMMRVIKTKYTYTPNTIGLRCERR